MSFARKVARKKAKAPERAAGNGTQSINLVNPVAEHFPAFIVNNATHCDRVAEKDGGKGQKLVICGAGPSLLDHLDEVGGADQVWGCNSAAVWLHDQGYPVTHAFTVDQTPAMVEEWYTAPPLEYMVASTIHPHLTEHLLTHDRRLTFFHNYVGITAPPVAYAVCGTCGQMGDQDVQACEQCGGVDLESQAMAYEDWLYCSLYLPTGRCGSGLNAVTRAIDLAQFMGFAEIVVLGADCALKVAEPMPDTIKQGSKEERRWLMENTIMHADGGHALASGATPVTLGGWIDGRYWLTKPDMVITAAWLAKMAEAHKDTLRLVGDTLPAALQGKSDEFLARLPALVDSRGRAMEYK